MDKKQIIQHALINAAGVFFYTCGIAWFMSNTQAVFQHIPGITGIVMMLMLFVLSAALVGALVLGKPVLLYFENKKSEALKLFLATLAWLFAIFIALVIVLITTR